MFPADALAPIGAVPGLEPASSVGLQILMLALATLVSEDLTCIAAGILVHDGRLTLPVALMGCFVGIFTSDLGLWTLGRLCGRWLMRRRWFQRRIPPELLDQVGAWFHRRAWAAVLAARFLPGTRVPVFIAAGILGARARAFITWALLAGLLWTPFLVGLASVAGSVILRPLQDRLGSTWVAVVLGAVLVYVLIRAVEILATEIGRARFAARLARLWRWEFWPEWALLLPLLPALGWLALRHRGLTVPTAANPGLRGPAGPRLSMSELMRNLPADLVAQAVWLGPQAPHQRLARLTDGVARGEFHLPFVLTPDHERDAGTCRLVRALDNELHAFLRDEPGGLWLRTHHPGPHEAAILCCRLPETGEPGRATAPSSSTRIVALATKQLPAITGDGRSTVERLIWRHRRHRMQARVFMKRFRHLAGHVLARGESMSLAATGGPSEGVRLRDGAGLITPALEQALDPALRALSGCHFIRFDVRYADPSDLMTGRGFQIVRLADKTVDMVRIAGPNHSLLRALRSLHQHWRLRFEIGARNRALGHATLGLSGLLARLAKRPQSGPRAPAVDQSGSPPPQRQARSDTAHPRRC